MPEPHPILDVPQQFAPATSHQVRDEPADYVRRDLLGPWDGREEQFRPKARGPRDRYGSARSARSTTRAHAGGGRPDAGRPGRRRRPRGRGAARAVQRAEAGRLWASSMGMWFTVPADLPALAVTAG
jgi:hypothetical protein